MTKEREHELFLIICNYAYIQIKTVDSSEKVLNQCKNIVKYFQRRKPINKLKNLNRKKLEYENRRLRVLDRFLHRKNHKRYYNPFVIAMIILEYLLNEKKYFHARLAFAHINPKALLAAAEETLGIKVINEMRNTVSIYIGATTTSKRRLELKENFAQYKSA